MSRVYRKIFEYIGLIKSYLRIFKYNLLYKNLTISYDSFIDKNCSIHCDNDSFMTLNKVTLAKGVVLQAKRGGIINIEQTYIGFHSVIVAINSITIKKNTEISEMVTIRDQNHKYNFTDTPISKQGFEHAPITINENVWIGAKSSVLKGVIVGKNSIVGAHSFVNKSVNKKTLVVGTPAKAI